MGHSGFPVTRSNTKRNPCLVACETASIELAVVTHRDQLRRGIVVVVPQIVMNHLEVPEPLPGAGIQREQGVAEEIAADAIGAVVVIGRRAGREVGDAALFVHRNFAPRVGAAGVFPRVLRPRVVADFARDAEWCERSIPVLPVITS